MGKWRHVTEEELRALRAVVDAGEAQAAGQREKTKANTAHDEGEENESEHEGTDVDNDDDGDEEDFGDGDNDDGDQDLAKLWEAEHAAEESRRPIQQPQPEGKELADVK